MFQKHKPSRPARALRRQPLERLGARRVEDDPAAVDEDHPRRELERPRDAVLGEHDRGAEPLDGGEEERRGVGVELRGRLVEQEQLRLEREGGGEAHALELTARELHRLPSPEVQRIDGSERPLDPWPDRSGAVKPRFSSPNATSFATMVITTWSSGSWKTLATVPASWAGRAERVSRPVTTTRPVKRPPWKCGTSPASARSSVDFPDPEGPSSATTSPGSSSSETSSSAGAAAGYA